MLRESLAGMVALLSIACSPEPESARKFLRARARTVSSPALLRIDAPEPLAGARFGQAIADCGDLTGDGVTDFVVGAPGADRAYVFSGAGRSLVRRIDGPDGPGFEFGHAIRCIPDLDGDGVRDIAIGAPGPFGLLPVPSPTPPPEWGRVHLFSGAGGELIRTIVQAGTYVEFGFALEDLGDVNADGVPDLGIGAPMFLQSWGVALASSSEGTQIWARLEPPYPGERQDAASFGMDLARVGDVNGDGVRDVLVAGPVHDLDPDPDVPLNSGYAVLLSGADGTVLRTHTCPSPAWGDNCGQPVASIGDQDGDGIDEYVLGDRGQGAFLVFDGASGALLRSVAIPGDPGPAGRFAYEAAPTGDKDGDGKPDFWVSAHLGGQVFLLNAEGALLFEVDDPAHPEPPPAEGGFGRALATTADLGGDDGPDLLVGKPAEGEAGAVFLVLLPPPNHPPAISVDHALVAVGEGRVAVNSGAASDPDGDALTIAASAGSASIGADGAWTWSLTPADGPAAGVVTISVDDGRGGSASIGFALEVANLPPWVGAVAVFPAGPVSIGTPVGVSAPFADPGVLDAHTAAIDWGDGTSSAGTVLESGGSGGVEGARAWATPGVYTVRVMVTDQDGGAGESTFQFVVVFDPAGGFVTGGGFIDSPPGAYSGGPASGAASFGFVSRYQKGASAPSGSTEFRLHFADFRFRSTAYEWLVVSGARASFKGTGTVNGAGNYSFLLTAVDGDLPGGGGRDRLRMKIVDRAGGGVVYDNQRGEAEDGPATTALAGGSIMIHR